MKILLVTQWFEPEPTFKGLLFAKSLRDAGHEVEVLTGFPNYPGGLVYDGYKLSFYQREVMDGIVVHRAPLFPSHDFSGIKRALNYLSFALSSFIVGLLKTRKLDVIYGYHPPLTTPLSCLMLSALKRVPLVVDVQDLWPDTLSATGMIKNKMVLSLVNVLCNLVYRKAAKVVVLSPGFRYRLVSRGVPEEKIVVIYNWCNEPAIEKPVASEVRLPQNGKISILFAGNLGTAQGLPSIISAAEHLKNMNVPANIVFLGDGVAKQKAIESASSKELENVFFLPRVPMSQVGGILSSADVLLVHLNHDELFRITIPSRTQASLAVGKPIIMAVSGDAANLVKKSGAGIICEPNCPESLANSVKKMVLMSGKERDELSKKAKLFYYENLSLEKGVQQFVEVFEEVT